MWSEEEIVIINEYATVLTGKKSGREWNRKRCEISQKIIYLIERYGDDGYNDKPQDMNRVVYWISHLSL